RARMNSEHQLFTGRWAFLRRQLRSSKKLGDGSAKAVAGDVEGALFDFVSQLRRDAEGTEDRCVQVFDHDAFVDGFEWASGGGCAVQIAFLDAAAEEENGTGVGEMAMHAKVLQVFNFVRHGDLIFDLLLGLAFDE